MFEKTIGVWYDIILEVLEIWNRFLRYAEAFCDGRLCISVRRL